MKEINRKTLVQTRNKYRQLNKNKRRWTENQERRRQIRSACSLLDHKAHNDDVYVGGSLGRDPFVLNHGTRWECVVTFTPRPSYLQGRSCLYIFGRKLGGANNLFECCGQDRDVLILPDIKPRFLSCLAQSPVTTIQPDLPLTEEKQQQTKEEPSKEKGSKERNSKGQENRPKNIKYLQETGTEILIRTYLMQNDNMQCGKCVRDLLRNLML